MFKSYRPWSVTDTIVVILILCSVAAGIYSGLSDAPPERPTASEAISRLEDIDIEISSECGFYPEEALSVLKGYVYQYTGDYNPISQEEAEAALDALRTYYLTVSDIISDAS